MVSAVEEGWNVLIARADAAYDSGNAAAEALYLVALGKARAGGEASLETGVTLNHLGMLHQEAGRYTIAEKLLLEAGAILSGLPGPPVRELAGYLRNLAVTYTCQGRFAEAEELCLRSLELWSEQTPPDSVAVAMTEFALGDLYLQTWQHEKAARRLATALALRQRILGRTDRLTVAVTGKLQRLYRLRGKRGKVEAVLREAVAATKQDATPGPGAAAGRLEKPLALVVARLEDQLGLALHDRRAIAEGEAARRRGLALLEQYLGLDHPRVGVVLMSLAEWQWLDGRFAEAEKAYRRSVDIFEKTYGASHPWTATALHHLGNAYAGQGRTVEAESLYERTLAILGQQPSGADLRLAEVLRSIALLCQNQGRQAEALKWFRRAYERAEQSLGSEDPALAAYLEEYAASLKHNGRGEDAQVFERRVARIQDANRWGRFTVDVAELAREP
jgi:tetratricopeptide (TPR) repeat protein